MAYSYRLKLVEDNAVLDRIDIHGNDWLQRSSGFAIELSVRHHLQHHSFQRFLYMDDYDFQSTSGMERFLMNIVEFVDGNEIQLTLPNPNGVLGSLCTGTVYSLEDMVFNVCKSVWLIRDCPRNFSMKFVPLQMELEVLPNQNFQTLKEVKVEGSSSLSVDCSICLKSEGTVRCQTPCTHIFHTNCILSWLQREPSCPICRAPVHSLSYWNQIL